MDTITNKQVAKWMGVSSAYVGQIRSGKKTLGKRLAKRLADEYGLSYELLSLKSGEEVYNALRMAYQMNGG